MTECDVPPILVYDGECGFCARSVQFILNHERRHDLLFVPRQSALGIELRREYKLEAIESMVWIEAGEKKAFIESDAVLKAATYLEGIFGIAALGLYIPTALRNRPYRWIAAHRQRLSRNSGACLLPTPEQRARFMD
ncbi:MAG: DCC1-like thiol-disulfide oxidoreductase family protein [Acidobacteriaceae bacterium]